MMCKIGNDIKESRKSIISGLSKEGIILSSDESDCHKVPVIWFNPFKILCTISVCDRKKISNADVGYGMDDVDRMRCWQIQISSFAHTKKVKHFVEVSTFPLLSSMKSTALKTIHFLQLLLHGSEAFLNGGTQQIFNLNKSNNHRKHDSDKLVMALVKDRALDFSPSSGNRQLNYVVVGGGWGGKMERVFSFLCRNAFDKT